MAQQTKEKQPEAPAGPTPDEPLRGQITQPNPLELFWEKNKRWILLSAFVIIGLFGGMRLWQHLQRLERNRVWSTLTSSLGLDSVYVPSDWSEWELNLIIGYRPFQEFQEFLANASAADIERIAADFEGKPPGNIALWMLASRYAADGDQEAVQRTLAKIESTAPKDPGLVKREYPPIYVPLPEGADKEKDQRKVKPPDPDPASIRGLALAKAARQAEFRKARPDLYEPPEPDPKPACVFETSAGKFTVRLYASRAPKHCAQFLENCEKGVYDGLRFHEIRRRGTDANATYGGDLALLGDPESKNEDPSKWGKFQSEEQIENEDSRLSHYPFMVGFEREEDKVGSDKQLLYFTASDSAEWRDGSYVVFGRVTDGQEVLRDIIGARLSSTAEESSGRGKPQNPVKVEKVTVEK